MWVADIWRGRLSLENDARSGRTKTVTTPEMANQVHDIIIADRRGYMASTVGISQK